jgi:hypothetical protein
MSSQKRIALLAMVLFLALFLAVPAANFFSSSAQAPPAVPAVWQAVAKPAFDASKAARVDNLRLVRDRIQITLTQGVIQFAQPAEGAVFAAAFRGTGQLLVEPPDARERQQLRLHTGADALNMPFTEAVFSFTDKTYDEIAAQVKWDPSAADPNLARIYQERFDARENYGAGILPRVVKGILSADRKQTEFFLAEVNTAQKNWVTTVLGALNPEEISVGRRLSYGGIRTYDEWLSFPRGNRTAAQAWANPIAREDLLPEKYSIFATVTDGAELRARVLLDLKPQWSGERVLIFLLDSDLRVTEVKDTSGKALQFRQPSAQRDRMQGFGSYLAVFVPEPLQAGQAVRLEFIYSGKRAIRNLGPGVFFCQSLGWYPVRLNWGLRSEFEMQFRSPKRFTLVATGVKTNETIDGNEIVTTWKSEKPMTVAGFAFGEVKVEKTKAGNVEVEVHANREADDNTRAFLREVTRLAPSTTPIERLSPALRAGEIASEMANSLLLFESFFGRYPYSRLAVSTIPYSYGQGWPSLIYLSFLSFLSAYERNALGFNLRAEKEITRSFRAHETSHQWWGHKVAWKSYHDQWLSEGFAEFSGNLYLLFDTKSWDEYRDRHKLARQGFFLRDQGGRPYDSVGPIWMGLRLNSSQSPDAYQRLVYEKGGFVLHMLRMMLFNEADDDGADATFKAMMREFTRTYDNKAASTEDFKAVAEKYMTADMNLDGNGRLDWFFNQYVYGTGIPTYEFKYAVTPAAGGQWKLSGTVTQSGVPEGWKDVLPIYMEFTLNNAKKMLKVGNMSIMQRVTPFEQLLALKPERVVLCLNEDSIAVIKQ